ncbi:hypothetical protein WJX84_008159 [Apatococcus fuscideae]|uniref:Uncharacterized protein n=1 Tax=Apatococcus fuscideae TaxID=2026836 RepID=A0AAW1SAC8_9CHLO
MEGAKRPPGHKQLLLQLPRKGDANVSEEHEDWGTEYPVTAGSVGCGNGRSLGMEPSEKMELAASSIAEGALAEQSSPFVEVAGHFIRRGAVWQFAGL